MTDTSQYIREIQRKIWLEKTPAERLLQALQDNETLYVFLNSVKKQQKSGAGNSTGPHGG